MIPCSIYQKSFEQYSMSMANQRLLHYSHSMSMPIDDVVIHKSAQMSMSMSVDRDGGQFTYPSSSSIDRNHIHLRQNTSSTSKGIKSRGILCGNFYSTSTS